MQSNNKKLELDVLFENFVKQSRSIECNSPITIKNYRENYASLKKFKPDVRLTDLTPVFMADFFDHMQTRERVANDGSVKKGLKNSSVATIRGKLSAFFSWLKENGYLKVNPFECMKYPDVSYTDKRAFTKEEFDKIFLAVSRDMSWGNQLLKKRNIAFIITLFYTGIRKGEILGLKLSDLDMKNQLLTVRAEISKSKRTRIIPVHQELMSYLEEYLALIGDYTTNALWVSNNNDRQFTDHGAKHFINHLSVVTGINCHLHRFRHTFAVNYYVQTHDILGLQRLMGHRDIKMTLSYLRSLPDDEIVRQMNGLSIAKFK
jgi:integrase/recombinase XerD